jgi:hypothetical protein
MIALRDAVARAALELRAKDAGEGASLRPSVLPSRYYGRG